MAGSASVDDSLTALRQWAMALCADATRADVEAVLAAAEFAGEAEDLRRPEVGLVMARGRMGGDGRAFNLGEATVARAAVRLPTGETGVAYQLGRDLPKARFSAIVDALLQGHHRNAVETELQAVAARLEAERTRRAREVAATRVNFFTMVRGDD